MILLWLKGLLARRPGRLLGAIAGVALTVALLASIGAFTVASAASMTQRAIASVPVDWQIALAPGTNAKTVADALKQVTPYSQLQPVGYAESHGFSASTNGTVQTTGAGKVLGISPQYRQSFPAQLRSLIGSLQGVLVAQQTAANLHVTLGDTVTIQRLGLPPVTVTVNGVVELPYADSLFQAVGNPAGVAPQAPPDNVLLMPLDQWHQTFDPQAAVRPDSIRTQLHVRINHSFSPDPEAAYIQVEQSARNLEAKIAGNGVVGDNLAARLDGTRQDALYAKVLFLFLGLPGAILAVLLTVAVAATGRDRRRQEQALLRVRGATSAQILWLASVEAMLIGTIGMALGLGLAIAAIHITDPIALGANPEALFWVAGAALAGLALAMIAVLYPAWTTAHSDTVMAARTVLGTPQKPLWQRGYVDYFLLVLSAIAFWQTASTGYQVVLAPEGIPQASVSYETFIAPVCLWLGAGLLILRLGETGLNRGRPLLARVLRPAIGNLAGVIAAFLSRQRLLITRGIVLVALAFSFAISTAVFNTTYNAQSRVDAELTNGADLRVTLPPNQGGIPNAIQEQIATLPNVSALQPMLHRFAYVGKDLQDFYGIDPLQLSQSTDLANAYFANGDSQATMAALAARPDALLVAEETVTDFQLQPGDLVNLQLQNAKDSQYHVVPFHFIGVVREFPTALKDSFLVANASYVAQQTQNSGSEILLIKTKSNLAGVKAQVELMVRSLPGVQVTDIDSTQRTISSSLTAVDLRGLTRLELSFAVLLLAGATGLVMALSMAERRRTFAILSALGAKHWQLGAFLWSEGLLILLSGGLIGSLIGFSVAQMLVKVLKGAFDPPPDLLHVPWIYLGLLAIAAAVATIAAVITIQKISVQQGVETRN